MCNQRNAGARAQVPNLGSEPSVAFSERTRRELSSLREAEKSLYDQVIEAHGHLERHTEETVSSGKTLKGRNEASNIWVTVKGVRFLIREESGTQTVEAFVFMNHIL